MKKINLFISAFIAIAMLLGSCTGGGQIGVEEAVTDDDAPANLGQAGVDEDSEPNILKIALGSPDHTTLVAAV